MFIVCPLHPFVVVEGSAGIQERLFEGKRAADGEGNQVILPQGLYVWQFFAHALGRQKFLKEPRLVNCIDQSTGCVGQMLRGRRSFHPSWEGRLA
ncbi:hypothetical protein DENIT_110165 [Pseudomonas veronii]|nr:hypothetical protein DENIT_110165 [Pseudomonas veronii]